ncbi:hypothetical protein V8E36_003280 [Tilletia maclaganii]
MQLSGKFLALASSLSLLATVSASPVQAQTDKITRRDGSVLFDDRTFVNKGLVGFGRISGDAKDSYGETLGGFGSAIAIPTSRKNRDGTYTITLLGDPDRGHNTQTTMDYRSRQHKFTLTFDPSKGSPTEENIVSQYVSSVLWKTSPRTFSRPSNFTTGLDPTAVKPAGRLQPALPIALPNNHISFDTEGLALDRGSSAWISDEYGPYIYSVDRVSGQIKYAIQPPQAILPYINGTLNFTSITAPDTGRAPNQGFDGLTIDRNTRTLWAILQSATQQDGASLGKTKNRNTRLLGYDVSDASKPKLVSEYVVQLPQSSKGNTRATSEIHIVDSTTFLILSRDGNGFGDTSSDSTFKQADLFSIKGATNIANTKYDLAANPVAPGGQLVSDVTPATITSFVNLIDKTELAKFGLQVGGAFDRTLVSAKLESLALFPAKDKANPDDYFLVVVADNDFISANGAQAAETADGSYLVEPYADPYAVQYGTADNQIFIYRVTLPGYNQKPVN